MYKKTILIFLFLILSNKYVYAESNFNIDENVEYKVFETGNTAVTHTITINNNSTYNYAESYRLELSNLEPINIKAFEDGSSIPLQLNKEDSKYTVNLKFSAPVTGKNKSRTFIVTYEESNLANLNGEVWEISIPKLISKYNTYRVFLSVPSTFGKEAFISPEALEKKESQQRIIYIFDGRDLVRSGINAVFGKFQVFSLKLKYHLNNYQDKKALLTFAIPPDTSTQRLFYTNITPAPINIETDEDGNWIASYELQPKKNQEIAVEGYAQVFANPVKLLSPYPATILANIKPQKYWESDDPKIKEIAQHLKTPKSIYDFVTNILTYNYNRVKPEIERLGAKRALSETNNSICTEYTDLFIALSRAAGIPAREINGYAYSDNPDLQPLSLISDVLHSWPEYWDNTRQNWIPIDPTWESTSNVDYFNKLDLKHVAFVIHGKSSSQPTSAGSYKSENLSKDIFIEYSSLPNEKNKSIEINYKILNNFSPFNKKLIINIKNNKSSAEYNISPKIIFLDNEIIDDNISVLPPFGNHSIELDIPIGLFALKAPSVITVTIDHTQKDIYLNKTVFVTYQLLIFLSILLTILLYIGFKSGKLNINIFIKKSNILFKNVFKT